ncbi:MAG: FtsQ-type POTRA domain-containing protein [Oscillospiraceae bacterium]
MDKRKKQNKPRSSMQAQPPLQQNYPQRQRPQLFDQMAPPPARTKTQNSISEIMLPIDVQSPSAPQESTKQKKKRKQAQSRRLTRGEARRRRTKRRIFAAMLIVLTVITGFTLSMTVLFKIEKFELVGDSPYDVEEIILAFAHSVGDNMFSFDTKKTQAEISKVLPYIESIEVRRRLPGTIVFKAVPAVETYYMSMDGGYAVLSSNLKVLRVSPELPTGLIEVAGARPVAPIAGVMISLETEERLSALKNVLNGLAEAELSPISQIDITSELEISFLYDMRARVLIGTDNDLADKLALAKTILTKNIEKTERGTLDVSHQNENEALKGVWRAGK